MCRVETEGSESLTPQQHPVPLTTFFSVTRRSPLTEQILTRDRMRLLQTKGRILPLTSSHALRILPFWITENPKSWLLPTRGVSQRQEGWGQVAQNGPWLTGQRPPPAGGTGPPQSCITASPNSLSRRSCPSLHPAPQPHATVTISVLSPLPRLLILEDPAQITADKT